MTQESLQTIRDAESKAKAIVNEAKSNAGKQLELAKQNAEKMITEAKDKEGSLFEDEKLKSKFEVEQKVNEIHESSSKEKLKISEQFGAKKEKAVNSLVQAILEN